MVKLKNFEDYYGNVCRKCFKSETLKKCGSCKAVYYCSVQHQTADLLYHKSICKVLKSTNNIFTCPKNGTFEDFTEYRRKLGIYLKENLDENNITPFLGYSKFPWVCAVCYSKDNLNYECEECKVVVYCSLEHKNQDRKEHLPNCNGLKMAKIFDSVGFSEGLNCRKIIFVLKDMSHKIQDFPPDMIALSHILQNEIRSTVNVSEMVSLTCFNDSLSKFASILYALQKIGLLRAHIYQTKPSFSQMEIEKCFKKRTACLYLGNFNPLAQIKMKNSFVIHFVAADNYEINHNWYNVLFFLFQWLRNINYIEFILIGRSLLNYKQPISLFPQVSNIQYYPLPYETIVDNLVKPDLVVLYNYDKKDIQEFQDHNVRRSLFSHCDVPFIITSTNKIELESFIDVLSKMEGNNVKLSVHKNPFAEKRPYREWDKKQMSVFYKNEYIAVVTKT